MEIDTRLRVEIYLEGPAKVQSKVEAVKKKAATETDSYQTSPIHLSYAFDFICEAGQHWFPPETPTFI